MAARRFITFLFVFLFFFASMEKAYCVEKKALSSPQAKSNVSKEYKKLLRDERILRSQSTGYEKIVSGFVALGIGVYGYYFDKQNTGRQLAYSATQTAGVFMISNSLLESESPSLLLDIDHVMKQDRELAYADYRRILVANNFYKKRATYKQVAYSSGILATLYAYNGYQERRGNVTLRNVFAFLSVNFAAISGASFFQLSQMDSSSIGDVRITVLPFPSVALAF